MEQNRSCNIPEFLINASKQKSEYHCIKSLWQISMTDTEQNGYKHTCLHSGKALAHPPVDHPAVNKLFCDRSQNPGSRQLKPTRCTVNDLLCALINLADPLHIHQHDDIIHRHTRSHCTDEHNKPHSISGSRFIFPPGFLLLFIASLIFPVDPRNHWDRDDRRDCPNSHIAAQTAGKCKCRYCDLHTPFDQNRTEQIPDNSPCFPVSHSSSPPSLTQKLFELPLHFHLQNPVP